MILVRITNKSAKYLKESKLWQYTFSVRDTRYTAKRNESFDGSYVF